LKSVDEDHLRDDVGLSRNEPYFGNLLGKEEYMMGFWCMLLSDLLLVIEICGETAG